MATQHRRPPVPVIVVALLALGGGIWWWFSASSVAQQPTNLTVAGAAESREYPVSGAITAQVKQVAVAEGDRVTHGDALLTMDDTALRLQVRQSEQGVKAAKAALTNARDDGTDADVVAAKARLAQAEAAVELAALQRGYASVTAPRDGIVVSVATSVGQFTSPGRTLLTLVDPSDVFARVFVPEPRMGEVSLGAPVRIASGSTTVTGKVTFIASTAEFTPNTVATQEQRATLVYQVRVTWADPAIKPGMPVDVTFE